MTATVKPKPLRPGARLAVLSPASAASAEKVRAGMQRLVAWGYEPVLMPHALDRGPLYYAGTVEDRVADLHEAFADQAIDGIVCTRGGWGSAELLPLLDRELIRANPKVCVAYSDLSSLQTWLRWECGLVCFYGPMVAADFAKADGVEEHSWRNALEGASGWSLGAEHGLRVLKAGSADGVLEGGCLSILTESLGTPYAWRGGEILFLEDIGTKPYQWDRMLCHLRHAGALERAQGIVLGDMAQCVKPEEMELLEGAVLHALSEFEGPVLMGLRCGHVDGADATLPLGIRVRLQCTEAANPRMHFLEAAVTL